MKISDDLKKTKVRVSISNSLISGHIMSFEKAIALLDALRGAETYVYNAVDAAYIEQKLPEITIVFLDETTYTELISNAP